MSRKAWRCTSRGVEWLELECSRCGAQPIMYYVAHHRQGWGSLCSRCISLSERRKPHAEYRPTPQNCEYVEIPVPVPSAQRTGRDSDPWHEQALAEAHALAAQYEEDRHRGAAILRLAAGMLVPRIDYPLGSPRRRPRKVKHGNVETKPSAQ